MPSSSYKHESSFALCRLFVAYLIRLPYEFLDFLLSSEPFAFKYSIKDLSSEPGTLYFIVK